MIKDPGNRENFTAFATACFINDNFTECISAVDSMLKVNSEDKKKPLIPHHLMELLMLKAKSLYQLQKYQDCLDFMLKEEKGFLDQLHKNDLFAKVY